jgi:O-antigen/teichoic acid export membrane protein
MNIPFKFAYNTIFQVVGRIATAGSTIAVTFLVARNFSVGDYGSFTAILSYIALFFVFSDFGLNAIFVRQVGGNEEKQREYFKNLLGMRLVISILVAFAATAILAFTNHPNLVKLGIVFALGIIIAQTFATSALALFQAKIRYDQALIADIFGAVANLIFVYIAVTNFGSILFVIIALVFGNLVRTAVALYLAKFQLGVFAFAFDINFWREILFAAVPIGLITVFSQFNAQIDKQIVLLANYSPSLGLNGETAAGIYGLSYKIFELAVVFPAYILNVGYPIMVRKKEEGTQALIDFAKRLGLILGVLGVVGLVLGLIFSPLVVNFLGGDKFSQSVFTTRLLLIGFPLFFITPLTLWLAITLDKTKELLFIYGFAAAFNLVANLIFVPRFGYNAAALITIVTEAVIFLMSLTVLIMGKNSFQKQ